MIQAVESVRLGARVPGCLTMNRYLGRYLRYLSEGWAGCGQQRAEGLRSEGSPHPSFWDPWPLRSLHQCLLPITDLWRLWRLWRMIAEIAVTPSICLPFHIEAVAVEIPKMQVQSQVVLQLQARLPPTQDDSSQFDSFTSSRFISADFTSSITTIDSAVSPHIIISLSLSNTLLSIRTYSVHEFASTE